MARKFNDAWRKKACCLGVLTIFKQALDCPGVWDGIHASGAHTAPPTGTIGVEGLQPTFCTVSKAPDLTLSKTAYTRFYGVLNDMVKAVYVHAPDKSKGHREQQIDISYDMWEYSPRLYYSNNQK